MSRPRPTTGLLAALLLVIVLLPAGYMGAYYAMLTEPPAPSSGYDCTVYADWLPYYRVQNATVYRFFKPAHKVDQRLRPHRW